MSGKMTNAGLKEMIEKFMENKTKIPKPKGYVIITKIKNSKIDNVLKESFQYSSNGGNYSKSVPFETLYICYKELFLRKEFTRTWFKQNFKMEYNSRPCNFTTIGGIFVQMNIADYNGNGTYILKNK